MKVTLLNGLYKVQKGHYDLSEVINQIKTGVYSSKIIECRNALNLQDRKTYNEIKLELPCFTPSGKFGKSWKKTKEGRTAIPPTKKHLLEYNGIVVLDYDDLGQEELMLLVSDIQSCPYTYASFFSPSGKGYKVLVKTSNKDALKHTEVFKKVRSYYQALTGVENDMSGSNFNRLCFISVDYQLNYNKHSKDFEF